MVDISRRGVPPSEGGRLPRYGEVITVEVSNNTAGETTVLFDGEPVGSAEMGNSDELLRFQLPRGRRSVDVTVRDAAGETSDPITYQIDVTDYTPPALRYRVRSVDPGANDVTWMLATTGGDVSAYTPGSSLLDRARVVIDGETVDTLFVNPTPPEDVVIAGEQTPVNRTLSLADQPSINTRLGLSPGSTVDLVPLEPDVQGAGGPDAVYVGSFDAPLWYAQVFGKRTGTEGTEIGQISDPGSGPTTGSPNIQIDQVTATSPRRQVVRVAARVVNRGDGGGQKKIKFAYRVPGRGRFEDANRRTFSLPPSESVTLSETFELLTDRSVSIEGCAELADVGDQFDSDT